MWSQVLACIVFLKVLVILNKFRILIIKLFLQLRVLYVFSDFDWPPESRDRYSEDIIHLLNLFVVTALNLKLPFEVDVIDIEVE